jgi:hypothetical protein
MQAQASSPSWLFYASRTALPFDGVIDYPGIELRRSGMVCAGLSAELRNTG